MHPLVLAPFLLSLEAPITRWDEAIPIGNGLCGGLLWGEGNVIRLSLDRGDLWDERIPPEMGDPGWNYANLRKLVVAKNQAEISRLFDACYDHPYPTKLPAGRIEITLPKSYVAKRFDLDMKQAEASVDFGGSKLTAFFSGTGIGCLKLPTPDFTMRLLPPASVAKLGYPVAEVVRRGEVDSFTQQAALGLSYTVAAARKGAVVMVLISARRESNATEWIAGTGLVGNVADRASHLGYDLQSAAHKKWWSKFWVTSDVKIPDQRLQQHYNLAKYFYGSASRIGAPPMPLQGVWTADEGNLPPWKGDYHNDLNTQTTYIAYQTAGLFDCGLAFLDYNWKLLSQYRKFAKSFFNVGGAVVPGVMTLAGNPTGGWGMYSLSPTNGAWIAQLFYRHWRYTMDRKFLKERAYPWCKEVGIALAELLDDDGKLPLSSSPEIFDNSLRAWLKPNSNYDLALMKDLYGNLASMAGDLGAKADHEKWKGVLASLQPLHAGGTGLIFAGGVPVTESHRHFSHLMAIHPLNVLDSKSSLAVKSVNHMLSLGTDWWTGYSFSWMACMLARTGDGERALEYLRKYMAFTLRNGFHANGDQTNSGLSKLTYRPFTLEGNFLAMEAVHEMLLQSHGGVLRVFPAVSKDWADVSFENLRAEGGFKVSATRNGGSTTIVRIEALSDGKIRLANPFSSAKWSSRVTEERGRVSAYMKKGEVLTGRVSH